MLKKYGNVKITFFNHTHNSIRTELKTTNPFVNGMMHRVKSGQKTNEGIKMLGAMRASSGCNIRLLYNSITMEQH
jgi:hypothetical protein